MYDDHFIKLKLFKESLMNIEVQRFSL